MIKKLKNFISKLFGIKQCGCPEKDEHLQLYEDVPEPEIRVVCEKHPDTYKKQCPSCRGLVNG